VTRRPSGTLTGGQLAYAFGWQRRFVRLSYLVEGERQEDEIELAQTDCNYGSYRQWFLCRFCDRRRRQLFLPSGRWLFACRDCCGLGYAVWRLQPIERLARRLERARLRCPAVRPRWQGQHVRWKRNANLIRAEFDYLVAIARRAVPAGLEPAINDHASSDKN